MHQTIYQKRRAQLLSQIESDALIILPAAPEVLRSGDTNYAYRQNSDFYYLTGFNEPEAICVLIPNATDGKFILFNRPKNPEFEVWHGEVAGQTGAVEKYGAMESYPLDLFSSILTALLENRRRIYYPAGIALALENQIKQAISLLQGKSRKGVHAPTEFHQIDPLIHEMRLIKSSEEIELLRKAAQISAEGHKRAMRVCLPGLYEYALEAELLYEFYRQGCRYVAYPPIVGGGANACILHYHENTARLNDGDLVLIDAAGEYQNYNADITRTFPVNGKFTPAQKAIYELVLTAQMAAIDMIKPGVLWPALQEKIQYILTEGLIKLGILKGNLEQLLRENAVFRFYMHGSGHWLGLDTHDVGYYKVNDMWRPLEAGFVLTVEPGLYISDAHKDIDPKWWNIGVRIEDDVLVTETGRDVLSRDVPKTVAEIESLMNHHENCLHE